VVVVGQVHVGTYCAQLLDGCHSFASNVVMISVRRVMCHAMMQKVSMTKNTRDEKFLKNHDSKNDGFFILFRPSSFASKNSFLWD
jgi:hypothetical protein